jgi:translation initiation factor IF-3
MSSELRVIDDTGKNLGVVSKEEALNKASEQGMDLIEIVPNAQPPVAKIMEFGKFVYQEKKREKEGRKGQRSETKQMRFSVRTSGGDLEFKAGQVDKFLKKRYKIRILMTLRGREKSLKDFANSKLQGFLGMIKEPYKVEQAPKMTPMGIMITLSK